MIFVYILKKNYEKIKVVLLLHRHNRHGLGNINLEIDDDSYININYIEKNNEDIEKNKNDISTNLIKINSNEDDILTNLNEINYLKNNKPIQYLKNVYNILFYDKKNKLVLEIIFLKKYLTLMLV